MKWKCLAAALLLLTYSCSTKSKLLRKTKESSTMQGSKQTQELKQSRYLSFSQYNDSAAHSYWFKLYPKGELQFNNGNFIGQLDSLVGYGKSLKLQRQLRVGIQDTSWRSKANETIAISTTKAEQVKAKQKKEMIGWRWLLPLLVLAVGFYFLGRNGRQ